MSLDLRQVLPQVEHLGQEAARRAAEAAARLPRLEQGLHTAASLDRGELERRLSAAPQAAHPARPTEEPIDGTYPLPAHPPRLRVVAADGSQVYPDRHGAAFFYMVNVGSLVLSHGSGEPPLARTSSRLHYSDEELHDTRGLPVDTHLINARRDAAEMEELARLAEGSADHPTLAILDNGLLLWAASQEQKAARPDVSRVLEDYLLALDRLHTSGAALAGYISRPRGANVIDLALAAGGEPAPGADEERILRGAGSVGVTDRLLYGRLLKPFERSARFGHPAALNDDFAARGHAVEFFYLHTGAQDGIARVEIPRWVAEDPRRLAIVHTGIVEQCRLTGVPYPLVRAHELALVGQDDRRALDRLVQASLVRHGIVGLTSQKAQAKRWVGRRRRHHV